MANGRDEKPLIFEGEFLKNDNEKLKSRICYSIYNNGVNTIVFIFCPWGKTQPYDKMIESLKPDMDQLMGILKVNLIDQRESKLIVMGHSEGAYASLAIVNEAYFGGENLKHRVFCFTSGLGLCDAYLIDAFEKNVIEFELYNYDLLNMGNQIEGDERKYLWKLYLDTLSDERLEELFQKTFPVIVTITVSDRMLLTDSWTIFRYDDDKKSIMRVKKIK